MSAADEPVGYMERTRHYYRSLGYERDHVWARFGQVPFAPLAKPLPDCHIALPIRQ
jgi:D-proline reductase (dithiol) PrdB